MWVANTQCHLEALKKMVPRATAAVLSGLTLASRFQSEPLILPREHYRRVETMIVSTARGGEGFPHLRATTTPTSTGDTPVKR
jgi:hypothetical protein